MNLNTKNCKRRSQKNKKKLKQRKKLLDLLIKDKKKLKLKVLVKIDHQEHTEVEETEVIEAHTILEESTEVVEVEDPTKKKEATNSKYREVLEEAATKIDKIEVDTEEENLTIREISKITEEDMKEDNMLQEMKNRTEILNWRKIWLLEALKSLPRDLRNLSKPVSHLEKAEDQDQLKVDKEEVIEEPTEADAAANNSNSNRNENKALDK